MRSVLWLLLVCIAFVISASGRQAPDSGQIPLHLMPLPSKVERGSGQMLVDQSFTVGLTGYREDRLEKAGQRFLRNLSRQTGMPLNAKAADSAKASLVVHTDHASKAVQEPGEDESYTLEVTSSGAKLSAATPLGTMHGFQTFLQLVEATPTGFSAPVVTIHDTPRFPWRGLMIDAGRHFIPVDVIKRNLDGMEAVKMNVFHWHLSENQGFRVESRKFPKLHQMGSDGLFYTQDEVRDLIEYARDRGIRVYPEFDMPGHSTAWFVGYPELASAPGSYEIERKWGIFDPAMDPSNERVYKFLDELIGEMSKLFPDPYFHIGGDEVNGKQWDANPKIQEFMKSHQIKDNAALQTYFTDRVQKIVSKHHKIMVGWDEILSPDIPKDIVIQSWRGQESLATAAKQGYRGLLSNGYYIDLMWSAARHYAVDPTSGAAANLSPEEKQRILGGEATMWSEYVSPENVDSRIWPRTAAIAERLWSPEDVRDVTSMYNRLDEINWRLDFPGLTHNTSYVPMLQRIAGRQDIQPLRVLADVVEPVKDYTREETAPSVPLSTTPLNRLVDAARPESETARLWNDKVDMFIAGKCKDAAKTAELRGMLSDWRDNEANLQPIIESSFLLKEVAPTSQNLSALGRAGLQALDYIDRGAPPADTWKTEQLQLVERSKKQNGQLLLMIVPGMEKLIQASLSGEACQTAP